jgi:hypothetical protein
VVVYEIRIYTGTRPGAETESNVFINLFGTRGDSGKRRLHQSKSHKAEFQRGQVMEKSSSILPPSFCKFFHKRHTNREFQKCSSDIY